MPGTLYIVSTPIGNLDDFTFRGVQILNQVDLIASEDTRRTGILLRHFEIKTRQFPYHDHNKEKVTPDLINRLNNGLNIALVSDAGTPGISDPGFYLIREAINQGVDIVPIPGPTSAIAALVASGMPTDRFLFEGYFPGKKKKREQLIKNIKDLKATFIIFETPHAIIKTMSYLNDEIPEADCCIARELTKKFEEILRGTVAELFQILKNRKSIKGEFVILLNFTGDK